MNQQERQAVIDEYMTDTGKEVVTPLAFVEWLRHKGNHPAHSFFFAKSDDAAAMEYRMGAAELDQAPDEIKQILVLCG